MTNKFSLYFCGLTMAFAMQSTLADVVYNDGELRQEYSITNCTAGEGCQKRLSVYGSHKVTSNFTNYNVFEQWLTDFAIEVSVLDATWDQPMESNVTIKVNGTPFATEKLVRDCTICKKRRRMSAKETATHLWSVMPVGTQLEFVFEPVQAAINTNAVTLNVKRFSGNTLIGSQSGAWFEPINSEGGTAMH